MSNPSSVNSNDRDGHGLGWVTLTEGVDINREWLSTHTPQLFTAWQQSRSVQERLELAQRIQQIADLAENDPDHDLDEDFRDPGEDDVSARVQWTETTRYEADLTVTASITEEELWAEISRLPDAARRTLDMVDGDDRIISVVDLAGDEHVSVLELSIDTGDNVDWGDVADSIDERIAQSPGWPALNAALTAAASDGWNVAATLPQLAADAPLGPHDPATELRYRVLNRVGASSNDLVPTASDDGALSTPRLRSDEPLPAAAETQAPGFAR